jgi:hypothetical protein
MLAPGLGEYASGLVRPGDPQASGKQRWPVLAGAACRVQDIPAGRISVISRVTNAACDRLIAPQFSS